MLWIDHKYVGLASNRLPKFKRKSDKLYSFRCVFCGDSQKDKNKTRGYLYVHKDRISYKCHNCNLSTSLYKLLNHLDSSLGNAYKLEQFSNNHSTFAHKVPAVLEKKPKIEPSESNILIDLGLIDTGGGVLGVPASDLNKDIGLLLNYFSTTAKKAAMFWDDSASRIVFSDDATESTGTLTSTTFAAIEIGALWVNDCAGQSQVISCTGSTRNLENITVDAGTF